jgi:hypothetical protein
MKTRRPPLPTISTAPLDAGRGLIADVAALARSIPLFPVDRTMDLGATEAARSAARCRIGWSAIFLKAYAQVAREMPVLRSWLAGRLLTRLATSSESVGLLAVNRRDDGVDRLWFARIPRPDTTPLPAIQAAIDRVATQPVREVFRRQLQLESLPGVVRRMLLRWNMTSTSRKRPTRIGTFTLSALAGLDATNRYHPTICTTSLSYGPLDEESRCVVTLIADHRVLDGVPVARALERLEAVLAGEIVSELTSLRASTGGAAA